MPPVSVPSPMLEGYLFEGLGDVVFAVGELARLILTDVIGPGDLALCRMVIGTLVILASISVGHFAADVGMVSVTLRCVSCCYPS